MLHYLIFMINNPVCNNFSKISLDALQVPAKKEHEDLLDVRQKTESSGGSKCC